MQVVVGDAGGVQTAERVLQLLEHFIAHGLRGAQGLARDELHAQCQATEGAEQRGGMLPAAEALQHAASRRTISRAISETGVPR
jgi:gamma-glutamyltranspeptidase